jgi:hypothetical protein
MVTVRELFLPVSCPRDKCFAGTLEPSPAEELGEGGSSQAIRRDRGEEDEYRQALAEVDVLCLLEEANVPANGCPLVPLRVAIGEEERELERPPPRQRRGARPRPTGPSVTLPRSSARRKR